MTWVKSKLLHQEIFFNPVGGYRDFGGKRKAGKKKVDIMLNPSYDIPKSTGPSNSLRAIESGFSLIRPVYNGYSYAVDYNGRILAYMVIYSLGFVSSDYLD